MKKTLLAYLLFLFVPLFNPLFSQVPPCQMERLNRGLIAVAQSSDGVFLSWRFLGTDSPKTTFNIYRNGKLIKNKYAGATNYVDKEGTASDVYMITAVLEGKELNERTQVTVMPKPYMELPLNKPAEVVMPDGQKAVYTPGDCSVGDVNGDGEYEIIVKWDPSNAHDNSHRGYSGNVYIDCYRLDGKQLWRIDLGKNIRAGGHYTQFMVYDLDGDGKSEVVMKTADGTVDGLGKVIGDKDADFRNERGYILTGPEYLTVFNGETGGEMQSIAYEPERGPIATWGWRSGRNWGDTYGNRIDRYLACVAYLDGIRPSVVMCRGYYQRSVLVAYDWRDGKLQRRWVCDSYTQPENAALHGQGNHNLSVGDLDGDGCDEIIYGSAAVNNDGKLMYSLGLGHGDASHLSDLDPDRPGLEFFQPHEGAGGVSLRAADGTLLIRQGERTGDNGRGVAADIDPKYRGAEFWSAAIPGVYNIKGEKIADKKPSINFRIYWDGDLQDELLNSNYVEKWNGQSSEQMVRFSDYAPVRSINGTKSTPNISVDLFGDWREEVILRDFQTNDRLYIFTTTIPSDHRMYTLMHDRVYRLGIVWQNVAYNQPPHLGFFLGDGVPKQMPKIYTSR